jgi:hypothetical protein
MRRTFIPQERRFPAQVTEKSVYDNPTRRPLSGRSPRLLLDSPSTVHSLRSVKIKEGGAPVSRRSPAERVKIYERSLLTIVPATPASLQRKCLRKSPRVERRG